MIMEVRDLSYRYGNGRMIFQDVNFSIDKGETITILGPNGAGKSTLFNCIANHFKPTSGEILLDGKPMKTMKLVDVAKKVGYVPQIHTPAYAFTVQDFVVMGRTPHMGMLSQPKKEDYARVAEVLDQLEIGHLAEQPYTQISGGERQKVTIARVLVQEPEMILLDEPTAHLDYGNQWRVISLVKELTKRDFAIIMTTHMPDHAISLGGRVGILDNDGRLQFGETDDILTAETLSQVYNTELKMVYIEEIERNTCVAAIQ
ncbi:ABC transporter ATP-binding protein [Eubacteriales bacterium OttesenSCG-928-M02]|nr:ABC transporter ATP-binding protein [Eubacteriales bacterium OttesenSCG-928-M02]